MNEVLVPPPLAKETKPKGPRGPYQPRYIRPKRTEVSFIWEDLDYHLLELLSDFDTLTIKQTLLLLPAETYRHVSERFQMLWSAGEIERLQGLPRGECAYRLKKGKQLPHRLARADMHLCVEQFVRAHPAFQYEWENEAVYRAEAKDQVVADARFRLWNPQYEVRFAVEIDQSWEVVLKVLAKMRGHIAMREALMAAGTYQPYRVLFATNNIENRLNRVLRRMAEVEESKKYPTFILYTDQRWYQPTQDEPPATRWDRLLYAPIWQSAHQREQVALLRR